jgi:hypothetical protein
MISKKLDLFTSFGLSYNYKCNIKCKCCYDLDLSTDQYLENDDAEKWIKECAELDIAIFINAGEPFVNWKWYKNIFIPLCNKYNTKYIFSTNGFWGNDDVFIEDVSKHVKNLTLSVDYWHQQWVPLKSIYNILTKLEKKNDIKVYISTVYDAEHPKEEVGLFPFEKNLTYIYYRYISDRWNNEDNIFTHDFHGNIIVRKKIIGKSIKQIKWNYTNMSSHTTDFKRVDDYELFAYSVLREKMSAFLKNKNIFRKDIECITRLSTPSLLR